MTSEVDKKNQGDIDHVEHAISTASASKQDGTISATNELYKSRYDQMTVFKALWTFRVAAFYSFLVFTGYMIDGFEVTMAGSIVSNKGFIQQFGYQDATGKDVLSTTWVAAWGAIIILAMTHVSWVADRYGRRAVLLMSWGYALISVIIMVTARAPPAWLMGKLIMGMAIGTLQTTVYPWTAECVPVRCRGSVMMVGRIWYAIGGIAASVMMTETAKLQPYFWQLPVYVEIGLIGVMGICLFAVPETPWFYGRRGNKEGCFKTMRRLYGGVPDYDYEEEWGIIVRSIEHERELLAQSSTASCRSIFSGTNGKRMLILLLICTGQQVGGNALISTYSTYFFQLAGLADPFTATMIQNCVALIAILLYFVGIDRIGRRYPTCSTFTLLTIVLWLIGALYYIQTKAAQTTLLALVCIWQPCFTLYTTSYYVIASELPSVQLRTEIASEDGDVRVVLIHNRCKFVWFYQALWGIALTFAAPPLLGVANIRTAFLFAGLSTPVAILLWFYLPETKARSVAEMDELFERGIPAWKTYGFVTNVERQLERVVQAENKMGA